MIDGVILFWFLAGVLNLDLNTPHFMIAVAAALAVLGTVVSAAWSVAVGEHLQRYKDEQRNLVWGAVDGVGRGMVYITGIFIALLAALMYVRVSDEVYQATGVVGIASTVIALAFAAAVVLVNTYMLYLSFSDGTSRTRELDRLGRQIKPHLRRRDRHLRKAAHDERRIKARAASIIEFAHRRSEQLALVPSIDSTSAAPRPTDSSRTYRWWR
jgi:MFS family permease